jgi:predicted DNA-binding transcriptional regulator YafY
MKKSQKSGFRCTNARFGRLISIIQDLKDKKIKRLADLAEKHHVTRKTITDDFNVLRSMDHDIGKDSKSGYWHYLTPPPGATLSEEELFTMIVAERVISQFQGTPFELPLKRTFNRFAGEKSAKFDISWDELRNGISFHNTGLSNLDLEIYETIVAGLTARKEIQFYYRGLKDDSHKKRQVRPYHVSCVNGQWYLIAYDVQSKGGRTFSLSRIRRPKILKTQFPEPDMVKVLKSLEQGLGIWGGKQIQVKLKFNKSAARWIQERRWHPTQEFVACKDGAIEMYAVVSDNYDLEQFILGWGELVEVLHPVELKHRIIKRLTSAARIYASSTKLEFPPNTKAS